MPTTTTPNMSLILPTPTLEAGPLYATELNTAFTSVDSHDHTTGKGIKVPSAGININADLSFNNKNATSLMSSRYQDQVTPLVGISDLGCLYIAGGNLYYNNGIGQAIQITAGAALNASSIGGIGGDYITSGASEYYTNAVETFFFTQAANTVAFLASGDISIYQSLLTGYAVTLKPSVSMAASFDLYLPPAAPATTRVVSMDSTGHLLTGVSGAIVTADIGDSQVTDAKRAALNYQISSSCGTFSDSSAGWVDVTNLTVTITTVGRPVMLLCQSDGTSNSGTSTSAGFGSAVTGSSSESFIRIVDNTAATVYSEQRIQCDASAASPAIWVPPSSVSVVDFSAVGVSGSKTYKVQVASNNVSTTVYAYYMKLVAYEV